MYNLHKSTPTFKSLCKACPTKILPLSKSDTSFCTTVNFSATKFQRLYVTAYSAQVNGILFLFGDEEQLLQKLIAVSNV